ncbi:AMP-binding enzyme family protein (macronuclear) [Tetrahymena thermophila SB210]|uniref:AMP-binding enzyme family protein n=1 Tax=Tetrahymena thermophila (strain SB210) TaxID=312017 RepID=I7M731_TETTS|nr:AMP-binding enzyme family protein [Tetrahymena thermophila SB210]EAR89278.2 AMP-binding enzyme family protein [Tetrahymena thermophila SB210]|eukprot:XP_001009523.2 AMP-binding enzyme family protein [Tetrahymena thermophila SB210]
MQLQNIDLFSQPFQFNIGKNKMRKRTILGAILSISVISIILGYFIYLLYQYLNNLIDPTYRSQSVIVNDRIDLDLNNDLFAFQYQINGTYSVRDLEVQQNKTYLVFLPYFLSTDGNLIKLNFTQCSNSELSDFQCIDFSTISQNNTLALGKNNLRSSIIFLGYRCQDVDIYKTTIPDNCAAPSDIDMILNNPSAAFQVKLYTSQYNITSQQMEVKFRNQYINLQGGQFVFTTFNVIKQQTIIKQGPVFQTDSTFSSPIQYNPFVQSYDRQTAFENTGLTLIMQVTIELDEIVEFTQIQFPTITSVFAQCNTVITALMCIGIIGRYISQKLLEQDIFMLILQNIFSNNYQKVLKTNNICSKEEDPLIDQLVQTKKNMLKEVVENTESIAIPSFNTKLKESIEMQQSSPCSSQLYENYQQQDEIKEQHLENKLVQNTPHSENLKISEIQITTLNTRQTENDGLENFSYCEKKLLSPNPFKLINPQQLTRNSPKNNQKINFTNKLASKNCQENSINQQNLISISVEKENKDNEGEFKLKFKEKIEHYSKKLFQLKDEILKRKAQKILFNFRYYFTIRNRKDIHQNKGMNSFETKVVENQIHQTMDVLQLFKDFIQLKKAVMVLFSKEQLAALQLVGCSANLQNVQQMKQNSPQFDQKIQNHFQKQYTIQQSQELQAFYIQKFLKRCSSNQNLSKLDLRILSSLSQN